MMVVVGTGKSGSKFLKTKYPVADGLVAGTTTQEGHEEQLEAEEDLTVDKDKAEIGL